MNIAHPPHRTYNSTRITPADALSFVSAYLENSNTDLSLHPNAVLTENGPITPSAGSDSGLVLHNLQRLEAGLRGEHIEVELENEKGVESNEVPYVNGTAGGDKEPGPGDGKEYVTIEQQEEDAGWQSMAEFEREQEDVEGDLGDRGAHVLDADVDGGEVQVRTVVRGDLDKDARKKAKKERQKVLKREMEEQRTRERDAER